MKKVILIGSGQDKTTMIEALVKAVEEKTGETIEFVNVHKKDLEQLTRPIIIKPESPVITVRQYQEPDKKTGHKRPYKYHR